MTSKTTQTSKQYFQSLMILFIALFMGMFMFGAVAFFINSTSPIGGGDDELEKIFLLALPIFIVIGITMAYMIPKGQLKRYRSENDLSQKLQGYRTVMIIKLALLEGPAFFGIVCYLLTSNLTFLGYAGIVAAVFLLQIPKKEKVIRELDLDPSEKAKVDNPDTEFQMSSLG